ncbi:hypothetical protein E3V93_01015 [Microbacterium sp. 3H14]|nr:hypothetical protein E3V93_01015 [Microbacterium sp. 3H14]
MRSRRRRLRLPWRRCRRARRGRLSSRPRRPGQRSRLRLNRRRPRPSWSERRRSSVTTRGRL